MDILFSDFGLPIFGGGVWRTRRDSPKRGTCHGGDSFYCISSRTAPGKLAWRDEQTLDGATGMSMQVYAPECECLSELPECDARSNSQLILFGDAADRRHEGLYCKVDIRSMIAFLSVRRYNESVTRQKE